MPQFAYSAIDGAGKEFTGSLEAADKPSAVRQLTAKGLQPFKIAESAAKGGKTGASGAAAGSGSSSGAKSKNGQPAVPTGPIRMSSGQTQIFTEELSELLEAGMRLEQALKLMEGKGDTVVPYRLVARRLASLVREGHPFSSALRMSSPSFGELYCSVAAAGEAGGSLGASMKRQAAYLAASREMKSKVMMALIYPAFLMVSGIGVSALFITFLIPRLMQMIKTTRGTVPAGAKFIMAATAFFKEWGVVLALAFVALIIVFVLFIRSAKGRPQWDKVKLKLPFVGGVLSTSLHAQFLETLASLSSGGLPLLRGLELASRVTENVYAQDQLRKSIDLVKDGGNLSRAMERTDLFPSNLIEFIRLGEHTGELPASLRRASDHCSRDLGKVIEAVAALMQPLIILILAAVVGVMAYLMISIIYDTMAAIQNR
jgi:general secretion pathway protein F